MEVTVVVAVFDRFITHFVGGSVDHATLDSASGHPGGVAFGVMIASGGVLRPGRASEFTGPDDQCVVQHSPLFEIFDQSCDRFVRGAAMWLMFLHVAMGVPSAVAAARMADLNEPHAPLGQAAREKQLFPKGLCVIFVDAVEGLDMRRFPGEIDRLGRGQLHAGGEFVGFDPSLDIRVNRVAAAKGGIRSMTKSIAIHCRMEGLGIRCNSVHPGSISTPMVHTALKTLMGTDLMAEEDPEATRIAMGIGEPEDVANMVLYLLSDESKHVTGAEMVVDNGDTVI